MEAAAQTYFGIPADALTLAQSAMLAGLITAPNHFDPYVRIRSARGRRNVVLRLMLKQEMITRDEFRAARHEPIVVRRATPVQRYPYPYFVDYFKQWFLGNPAFGPTRDARAKLLFTGGLHITTTLEPDLQKYAQTAVRSVLAYPNDPSGAMTVLDPRTGYVRAMVGGDDADYWKDQFAGRVNLATGEGGTGRQSGSSFKPFALVAALEHGISPSTVFAAPATIQIPLDNGEVWNVTNAEGSGYGSMTLESATINSVNTVYAQLIEQLGADTVVETATRMGLRCCPRVSQPRTPLLPYLSAVLGTNEVNTLEMSSAYGTLATGGQHVNPIPVIRVTGAKGNVLWEANPKPKQVVDPQVASVANKILEEVVLYGTGTAANIGRPQIGKTGTADTHTNAWFVGSLPQLTAAVWVGFPRAAIPMEPPTTRITVFGGTWPAQIWRLFMLKAAADLPVRSFPTPDVGYVTIAVDITQDPYCLPNPYTLPQNIDYLDFIEGTEPTKTLHDAHLAPERDGPIGDRHDPGPSRGGALRRGVRRRRDGDAVDAAARDRDLPDARGRHRRVPDQPGDDHRVDGRVAVPLGQGGPTRPFETNGSPSTTNRQCGSTPTLTPTRPPARIRSGGTGAPASSHTTPPPTRSSPSWARSTDSACASFPGPEQRSWGAVRPRAAAITASPSSGSSARSSTALPSPSGRVTTFIIQWWP